jgi:hypothetical protein
MSVVGDAFVTEGSTNVKFPRELIVPGYTGSLVILGTGTFFWPFLYENKFCTASSLSISLTTQLLKLRLYFLFSI